MAAVVEISLDQLGKNLETARRYIGKSMDQVRMDAAQMILAEMLRLVPRDTGFLASRISIRHSPGKTEIGPHDVPYAGYVEFGTAPHMIVPKTAQNLRFVIDGKTYYAKKVKHPGTKAQPYIQPAAEKWLTSIGVMAGDAAVKLIATGKQ